MEELTGLSRRIAVNGGRSGVAEIKGLTYR
jgi:hypothetical protein